MTEDLLVMRSTPAFPDKGLAGIGTHPVQALE